MIKKVFYGSVVLVLVLYFIITFGAALELYPALGYKIHPLAQFGLAFFNVISNGKYMPLNFLTLIEIVFFFIFALNNAYMGRKSRIFVTIISFSLLFGVLIFGYLQKSYFQ
jgi:hypothetical protein